jgi:alanine dehydrogenase
VIVGVPVELKADERRVGLTPGSVRELVAHDQQVLVETGAGAGIGADDADYEAAGARVVDEAATIWSDAELIVKVKEPIPPERAQLSAGQILFTYLHLAPDPDQTADLVAGGATCIAYETVTDGREGRPLLAPMSQVAGRMSVQAGAHCLEAPNGGAGLLLGGVPGVHSAKVVVIGGGVVGTNAIEMAVGLDAAVTVLDRDVAALDRLARRFGSTLETLYSTVATVEEHVLDADLVIGAVLVHGSRTPNLVGEDVVLDMRTGSVLVDVAIDQGGCFETSRPTTHHEPTFTVHGVVHYCVANMPGAVPNTSTYALNNATLPFTLALARKGARRALLDDPYFLAGLNVHRGMVTEQHVADSLGYERVPPDIALEAP